jgi:cellulose synthase/poly-beta-1,6-N-acetylglucosamine synthase-like glycosyltransferase
MDIVFSVLIILYIFEHSLFLLGLLKNLKRPKPKLDTSLLPSVTVIVAARNEENNIGQCIESLLRLNYPADKLQIMLVNDRSTDRTKDIILGYTEKHNRLKYLETIDSPGKLKGKPKALSQAIDKANGELIFTTDADSRVNPDWINEMVQHYGSDTGVASSYTIIEPRNVFWGMQSYDWLYLLSLASGSDGINNPLSCVGNNMSYRKKAYDEVGGYENIKFSVTEDFILLQSIKKHGKWKTKFPADRSTLNYTLPCINLKELYRQKKRWGRGGLDSNWLGYFAGVMGWSISTAIMIGWLFVSLKLFLLVVLCKLIADLILTLPVIIKFRVYKLILYFIPFEIYFIIYAFSLLFIEVFDRKVIWKDRQL